MRFIKKLVIALALASSLGACATQSFHTTDSLRREAQHPRILLMPPDVELAELTAGGNLEVNAQWTQLGTANLTDAVKKRLTLMNAQFIEFRPPAEDTPEAQRLDQLQKLHGAVGTTIRTYHVYQATRLPTKKGAFDWTLGPATQELGTYADADYALFVWLRDSYSTGGRAALKFLAAVALGVYIPGGIQHGHASLVDLKTGQVVWFNALIPREAGDLRTPGPAEETVVTLLDKLPK
jgi:hypothetical protein